MDFWDRLRDGIKDNDLTQEWIARKISVPIGTFKNWLTRRTFPDAQQIVEIAKLLNTSAEYLVTGAERENLTDDERGLLANYRKLSSCEQEHIALTVESWMRRFKGLKQPTA
jgi:transcriptional regulator with XRE-family HTH domain